MDSSGSEILRLARLRETVAFLCSPECGGRKTGSPEGLRARAYLEQAFQSANLEPAGEEGFVQKVPSCGGANLLGKLPGQGQHADRAILVAAHYDHLGWLTKGNAFWGADDNAAAVAILVDVAEALGKLRSQLGRPVVFCAFDAEEPPFFLTGAMGSMYFTKHPTIPLEKIDMMVCMDLMGHALGGPELPASVRNSVFVLGAERSARTSTLVDEAIAGIPGLHARHLASDVIPALSDYHAFELEQVPFLFLTNGRGAHYHQVTDTPEKLDFGKMLAISDFLLRLVLELSNREEDRIPYLADGRADALMLTTLGDLARELAPRHPAAERLLKNVEVLRRAAASANGLRASDRFRVSQMVFELEAFLHR